MPGRPDINPALTQVTADIPQYGVRNPTATQEQIDAAQAKADAISKAVGTTVDLVYPQIKGGHEGALVPDYNAAPIGFRFDNGQSQYVNLDTNGNVTGVQQRGGGLAAVLPFIEKAVEFVLPATIPFIEGANALYAASQGNIPAAIAGAMNMGVKVPGLDTSNLKSVSNYVTGANALAKGDIGTLVNSVANATSDDSMKSDLKDAASKISIAQSVANGNPLAALKAVTGAAGSNAGMSQAEQDALDAEEEAKIDAQMKAKAAEANAAEASRAAAGEDTIEGGLSRGLGNATDLGTVEVNGKNEPEAGFDAWTAPGLDSLAPVTVTGNRNLITDSGLPVNPNVGYHNPATELAPQTVTGTRGNNTITDSSLPVNANVAPVNANVGMSSTVLNPVTVTGTKGNNVITDSALPVDANVGTTSATVLNPVTVRGTREAVDPIVMPPLPPVTPLPPVVLPPVVPPVVKPPVVPPVVTPVTPTTTGGLPTVNDPTGIAGKVLTLGKMGDSKHYEEGLNQLSIPELKRWEELHDGALSNVDVFKNMQALNAQYPYQYAQGGAVQHFSGGGASDVQAMLDSANKADVMDALKGLGNLSSGLEPLKGKMMQLGQVGVAGQQKPLQQMSVIPQLAAILQARGMKFADGGRADHEHPEYDGIPVFRTGGLDGLGGKYVEGKGDGTSDDITAMLANGEYVFSADVVSALGNGSNKAGAKELDHMVQAIRARARSAPPDKLPPDAKSPLEYLKSSKGNKNG